MSVIRAADLELTDADMAAVSSRFGITRVEVLGGFENLLLRSLDPPGVVLRLTHASRRTVGLIEAEFDFMAHLARSDVPVVAPVPSIAGNLVEEIPTSSGDRLVAACMTHAPGRFRPREQWTDVDVERYGELVGALHHASASFRPGASRRPDWSDPLFDVGVSAAEESDPPLFRRLWEIRDACRSHGAGATGLLIHQDAHFGNLHITDQGEISLFDFDDCAYGTPTHDVAIVLFYWLMGVADDLHAEARRFVGRFGRGYERHASLPTDWPEGADRFLSLRELDLYWLINEESPDDLSPSEGRFMDGRRQRILGGVPFLGIPLLDIL